MPQRTCSDPRTNLTQLNWMQLQLQSPPSWQSVQQFRKIAMASNRPLLRNHPPRRSPRTARQRNSCCLGPWRASRTHRMAPCVRHGWDNRPNIFTFFPGFFTRSGSSTLNTCKIHLNNFLYIEIAALLPLTRVQILFSSTLALFVRYCAETRLNVFTWGHVSILWSSSAGGTEAEQKRFNAPFSFISHTS